MTKREKIEIKYLVVFLWLLSLTVIYPLVMVILTSFKEKREASSLNVALPRIWQWGNYAEVLEHGDVIRALFNSLFVSSITVILVLATASMLGYAIARRETRLSKIIDKLITFGIIAPFTAMPTMMLLQELTIYGSHWRLIFVYAALYLPFTTMIITSYIKGLPRELDEAAVIDGAVGMELFKSDSATA